MVTVLSKERFNEINGIVPVMPETRLDAIIQDMQEQNRESWRVNHCRLFELELSPADWQYYMDNVDKNSIWNHTNEKRPHFIYYGMPVIANDDRDDISVVGQVN